MLYVLSFAAGCVCTVLAPKLFAFTAAGIARYREWRAKKSAE